MPAVKRICGCLELGGLRSNEDQASTGMVETDAQFVESLTVTGVVAGVVIR
jgi:hypothetical protein